MFQFTGLPLLALFYSGESTRALPRVGFPIRRSRGQRLVSTSPGLIAAAHVLHRLSAPRHPPCALVLLIEKNTCFCRYGVFKVRADRRVCVVLVSVTSRARSFKTQQRVSRGRRCSRRNRTPDVLTDIERTDYTLGVRAPRFP